MQLKAIGTYFKCFLVSLLLTLSNISLATPKLMKQVLTLKELVDQAHLILIVEKGDPFQSTKMIRTSIWPWNPKYVSTRSHYLIKELVHRSKKFKAPNPALNTIIETRETQHHIRYNAHIEYYKNGVSRNPVYYRYDSPVDPTIADQFVIFCWYDKEDDEYELVALNAYESMDNLSAIKELIQNQK